MSIDGKNSIDDVPLESVETLETGLGKWSMEIQRKDYLTLLLITLSLGSFFFTLIIISIIREYYDPYIGTLDLSQLLFYSLILLICVFYFILFAVPLLMSRFNAKRHYIVFNLLSSSSEETESSLSSLVSLLSFGHTITPVESKGDSLLSDEQESVSSSTTSELQLSRFEISRTWIHEGVFLRPFVIAFQKNEAANTFIFYSRHRSCWNNVLEYLKINNIKVETLYSEKVSV